MKQVTILLSSVIAILMVFSACEIDDLEKPVIDLYGGDMEIVLNDPDGYIEPGYYAEDNRDGDVTSQVIVHGTVDVSKIGTYTLTYSVSDKAGNQASATRIVDVIVDQDTYIGSWSAAEAIYDTLGVVIEPTVTYTATVAASGTNPMKVLISNFGGLTTNFTATVEFDKFGNFTIPKQPLTGSQYPGELEGAGITEEDGMSIDWDYTILFTDDNTVEVSSGTWTRMK